MGKYLDSAGVTTLWAKIKSLFAKKQEGIFYVEGAGTSAKWTGTNERITSYYDGLTIAYKIKESGIVGTTLNINNLGEANVRKIVMGLDSNTAYSLTANSVIILVYTTINNVGYWVYSDIDHDTKYTAGSTNVSIKLFLVGCAHQADYERTYSHDSAYVGTDGCLYSDYTKVSVEGHTHTANEISGAVTTRDIFCIDLLTDLTLRELNLEGGQVALGDSLLTMVYGDFQDIYGDDVNGILISLNNGATEAFIALVNNDTDELIAQSGYGAIYNDQYTSYPILNDLNELYNYHLEVFTFTDYEELQNIFSEAGYDNIQHARNNLTYLCTIRLSEDKTKWIVE